MGIWAPDPMEKTVYITAQLLIPLCLYQGLNLALRGWRCFLGPAAYKADVLWMLVKIALLVVISGDKIKTQMIPSYLMLLVNLEVAGISMTTSCCEDSRSLPKKELHFCIQVSSS